VNDVTALLAQTINQVRCGSVDSKTGNAVGYLASVLLKALQQGDIEARLQALEAVHKARALTGRVGNLHADRPKIGGSKSSLKGREKVLAWMKAEQALGGFADHCKSGKALCCLEDAESAFLFHLINQCNTQVLDLNVSPTIRILALYLLRLELSDTIKVHEAEVLCLRPILCTFLAEGLALKGAIQAVCRDQTAG
jgi:hypothetical protein